jgi:hypothetical protein
MIKKILFLFLFVQFHLLASSSMIFMTHLQTDYDQEGLLTQGVENLLLNLTKKGHKTQLLALYNQLENWNGPVNQKINWIFSQYGEHQADLIAKDIYIVGAQLGACLQYTLRDVLKMRKEKISIHFESSTLLSIEGELLSRILSKQNRKEQLLTLHHYFSRMIFLDNHKKIKNVKMNVYFNKDLVGSLRDEGFKRPYKKTDADIFISF